MTKSEIAELNELAMARETVYSFLSRVLAAAPSTELRTQLQNTELTAASETSTSSLLTQSLLELIACLGETEDFDAAVRQDYDDLFNVPGPKYVKPYEAVFRDERQVGVKRVKGLLYGPSTDDVIRYYHVAGLEVSPDFLELPDHIALELHFMAHLCRKESEAYNEKNETLAHSIRQTELGFLENHLTEWIDDLSEEIENKASTEFYKKVGQFTGVFVSKDRDLLAESTELPSDT